MSSSQAYKFIQMHSWIQPSQVQLGVLVSTFLSMTNYCHIYNYIYIAS